MSFTAGVTLANVPGIPLPWMIMSHHGVEWELGEGETEEEDTQVLPP